MVNNLTHRFIARLVVEANTPIFIGSGDSSLITDAVIQKDHNGIPIIPGSALAGVLRHSLEDFDATETNWNDIFGFQNGNAGLGSRIIISSAYFLQGNFTVVESLTDQLNLELQNNISNLKSRQHVKINDKGVALKNGLFDNEVVYKGAMFIFEISLKGSLTDSKVWEKIISEFMKPEFRIGMGTRKGYGKLKVKKIYNKCFDLSVADSFNAYLNFNPSLNNPQLVFDEVDNDELYSNKYSVYTLSLKPDNFFIFSKGFGDAEVDCKPFTEVVMKYIENNEIEFVEQTVVPATSVKGALSHRVCFHYNKITKCFADNSKNNIGKTGIQNFAVNELFGSEKDEMGMIAHRGCVIIDDLYYDDINNDKIFNHVAIDRFTGGTMDGHLFSEKVSRKTGSSIDFKIILKKAVFSEHVVEAFENALVDLCKGLLPLGGMTTKGNGIFTGSLSRNNSILYSYQEKAAL